MLKCKWLSYLHVLKYSGLTSLKSTAFTILDSSVCFIYAVKQGNSYLIQMNVVVLQLFISFVKIHLPVVLFMHCSLVILAFIHYTPLYYGVNGNIYWAWLISKAKQCRLFLYLDLRSRENEGPQISPEIRKAFCKKLMVNCFCVVAKKIAWACSYIGIKSSVHWKETFPCSLE